MEKTEEILARIEGFRIKMRNFSGNATEADGLVQRYADYIVSLGEDGLGSAGLTAHNAVMGTLQSLEEMLHPDDEDYYERKFFAHGSAGAIELASVCLIEQGEMPVMEPT